MTTKNALVYFIVLFVAIAQLQCKNTNHPGSQEAMYKTIYIDQFKLVYFRKVLARSYNNSKAIQEIISSDHSGFAEPILTMSDYQLIDSLATAANEEMKIDSTNGNQRAEGAEGKRPLGFILDRLSSKWLDSIANKRYKNSGVKEIYNN